MARSASPIRTPALWGRGSAAAPARAFTALGSSLRGRFLAALFAAYHEEDLSYVVLRNHERWPEEFGNDIDLLLHADHVARSDTIIERAAAQFDLDWTARRGRSGHIVHRLRAADGLDAGIVLDFRTDLVHHNFVYLPGHLVLDSRRSRGEFFIPSPAVETLEIVLHCVIDSRRMRPSYRQRLLALGAGETRAFLDVAAHAVGPALARSLAHHLARGEPEALLRLRRRLLWACVWRHPSTLPVWLRARAGAAWDRLRAHFGRTL